jgi:RNA polymerase sigma-70 factor (ECF subfamily)
MTNPAAATLPQTSTKNFSSLEELYRLYGRLAFGLAMRVLADSAMAEEAVQEIFLRYWHQPDLYTAQSGPFIKWLLREVHYNCLERLKSSFNVPQRSHFSPGINPTPTIIIKDQPNLTQETGRINLLQEQARQALASLPQEHRNLLEMAFFKGLTTQEIAQATGQSIQIIRQTLTRGLVQLKEGL